MDELKAAAPSSTEPSAEDLASIAMGTNQQPAQEAGTSAPGESTAAALAAGAAPDLSAPSGFVGTAALTPSLAAADGEGAASGEGVASAAGASSTDDSGSATAASTAGISSPSAANSLDSLPSRIAQHLESIYQITVDHVRQLTAPADVAGEELKVEIDDLLHKLSNGIAVSDGRIVAKLAALRSLL
ncbi:hypothetical protein [Burkholderia cenocepacia]|uniref:hypothetical protein n=1 Tax=Burkholderia cenocepacia TaxID=95486 RepID=UPI0020135EBC|nr:hypothetical protein [Burkholderia cenocepacia]